MNIGSHFVDKGQVSLTDSAIRAKAPAVFAEKPSPKVSDKYGFVSTRAVIDAFRENGFIVTDVRGGLRGGTRDYGMHEVRLRAPDEKLRFGEFFTELIFFNSHDGSCAAAFDIGIHRVACDNGLVVANDELSHNLRRMHTKLSAKDVMSMTGFINEKAEVLNGFYGRMSGHILDPAQRGEFARKVVDMAYPASAQVREALTPETILKARRKADVGDDLWRVMNRAQENLLRGGMSYAAAKSFRKTRPISSMNRTRQINAGVWRIAEEFLPS